MKHSKHLWYQPSRGSDMVMYFKKLVWASEASNTRINFIKSIVDLYMKYILSRLSGLNMTMKSAAFPSKRPGRKDQG